ncbi:hypothetical protein [Streptomyces albipurpureus]|uniref:Integral membrane protein n=1 Tax=Streptomyces albipurpureus TaxID=2897419 RepID=A0ABT0UJZ4_9ACTN|nr:hypothetical protein [Streptomyces sp. CWNU-1]MCM2388957.1 hypothetical protein [Streptomyces sp. CWNU-1]
MAAHATLSARHHVSLGLAIPVALGAFFGFYAGFLRRTGEAVSWWDVLYGVVAGLIFTAVAYGVGRVQRSMPTELRAATYGALGGMSVGFLHSLTGCSILRAVGMGLIIGAVTLAVSFYVFYVKDS